MEMWWQQILFGCAAGVSIPAVVFGPRLVIDWLTDCADARRWRAQFRARVAQEERADAYWRETWAQQIANKR